MQHVATWKEGDEKWAYHEDSFANMATHKVSLDPYRLASRNILKCIKGALPEKEQRVEKASIDEVFMDLSAQVHTMLLERYPMLRGPPPYDDLTEPLPKVPTTVLDWAFDALVETGEEDGEDKDPDWDDVCMVIASEIVRDVRKHIKDTLHYTCSGGVARNKMLAKIGSGYKKPNQQTVIRNRAVKHFLSDMKFTKIRNLGGKLGDEAVAMFGTDMVKDLMEQPLDQLKKLGDDTGSWLYSTIRGDDNSEVNVRTQIKSMLSAKSFRPSINSFEQGVRWIRIFVADIFSRCVEEGVLENKRRPKTIVLHHRQGAQTRSRSAQIPQGKTLSEAILFDLAKNLLAQVVVDGRAWPCANLSLSVGGFEDGPKNNAGIGGFLVRGDEAKSMMSSDRGDVPPAKRRRTKGNIANFFGPKDEKRRDFDTARAVLMTAHSESTRDGTEDEQIEDDTLDNIRSDEITRPTTPTLYHHATEEDVRVATTPPSAQPRLPSNSPPLHHSSRVGDRQSSPTLLPHCNKEPQKILDLYFCAKCNLHLPKSEEAEHVDYHFALDLSKEIRQEERNPPSAPKERLSSKPSRGKGRPPGSGVDRGGKRTGEMTGAEKGQKKLFFG